jgi:hypothetical protein
MFVVGFMEHLEHPGTDRDFDVFQPSTGTGNRPTIKPDARSGSEKIPMYLE